MNSYRINKRAVHSYCFKQHSAGERDGTDKDAEHLNHINPPYLDSGNQLVHTMVCLMITETDVADWSKVHCFYHRTPFVQRSQQAWGKKIAGQERDRVCRPFLLDQCVQAGEVIQQVHIIDADHTQRARTRPASALLRHPSPGCCCQQAEAEKSQLIQDTGCLASY